MTIMKTIYSQFSNPHGILGGLAGLIMSKRPSNIQRNEWTVENISLKPDDTVLEIGYGPGLALEACGKIVTDGFIVGIDHSSKMKEMAQNRNQILIDEGMIDLRIGDIECRPIQEERFSKIYCANVAQFWKNKLETIEYLHELLLENGLVAITYQPRHRGATSKDSDVFATKVSTLMEKAGFKEVNIKELDLMPKVVCVIGKK